MRSQKLRRGDALPPGRHHGNYHPSSGRHFSLYQRGSHREWALLLATPHRPGAYIIVIDARCGALRHSGVPLVDVFPSVAVADSHLIRDGYALDTVAQVLIGAMLAENTLILFFAPPQYIGPHSQLFHEHAQNEGSDAPNAVRRRERTDDDDNAVDGKRGRRRQGRWSRTGADDGDYGDDDGAAAQPGSHAADEGECDTNSSLVDDDETMWSHIETQTLIKVCHRTIELKMPFVAPFSEPGNGAAVNGGAGSEAAPLSGKHRADIIASTYVAALTPPTFHFGPAGETREYVFSDEFDLSAPLPSLLQKRWPPVADVVEGCKHSEVPHIVEACAYARHHDPQRVNEPKGDPYVVNADLIQYFDQFGLAWACVRLYRCWGAVHRSPSNPRAWALSLFRCRRAQSVSACSGHPLKMRDAATATSPTASNGVIEHEIEIYVSRTTIQNPFVRFYVAVLFTPLSNDDETKCRLVARHLAFSPRSAELRVAQPNGSSPMSATFYTTTSMTTTRLPNGMAPYLRELNSNRLQYAFTDGTMTQTATHLALHDGGEQFRCIRDALVGACRRHAIDWYTMRDVDDSEAFQYLPQSQSRDSVATSRQPVGVGQTGPAAGPIPRSRSGTLAAVLCIRDANDTPSRQRCLVVVDILRSFFCETVSISQLSAAHDPAVIAAAASAVNDTDTGVPGRGSSLLLTVPEASRADPTPANSDHTFVGGAPVFESTEALRAQYPTDVIDSQVNESPLRDCGDEERKALTAKDASALMAVFLHAPSAAGSRTAVGGRGGASGAERSATDALAHSQLSFPKPAESIHSIPDSMVSMQNAKTEPTASVYPLAPSGCIEASRFESLGDGAIPVPLPSNALGRRKLPAAAAIRLVYYFDQPVIIEGMTFAVQAMATLEPYVSCVVYGGTSLSLTETTVLLPNTPLPVLVTNSRSSGDGRSPASVSPVVSFYRVPQADRFQYGCVRATETPFIRDVAADFSFDSPSLFVQHARETCYAVEEQAPPAAHCGSPPTDDDVLLEFGARDGSVATTKKQRSPVDTPRTVPWLTPVGPADQSVAGHDGDDDQSTSRRVNAYVKPPALPCKFVVVTYTFSEARTHRTPGITFYGRVATRSVVPCVRLLAVKSIPAAVIQIIIRNLARDLKQFVESRVAGRDSLKQRCSYLFLEQRELRDACLTYLGLDHRWAHPAALVTVPDATAPLNYLASFAKSLKSSFVKSNDKELCLACRTNTLDMKEESFWCYQNADVPLCTQCHNLSKAQMAAVTQKCVSALRFSALPNEWTELPPLADNDHTGAAGRGPLPTNRGACAGTGCLDPATLPLARRRRPPLSLTSTRSLVQTAVALIAAASPPPQNTTMPASPSLRGVLPSTAEKTLSSLMTEARWLGRDDGLIVLHSNLRNPRLPVGCLLDASVDLISRDAEFLTPELELEIGPQSSSESRSHDRVRRAYRPAYTPMTSQLALGESEPLADVVVAVSVPIFLRSVLLVFGEQAPGFHESMEEPRAMPGDEGDGDGHAMLDPDQAASTEGGGMTGDGGEDDSTVSFMSHAAQRPLSLTEAVGQTSRAFLPAAASTGGLTSLWQDDMTPSHARLTIYVDGVKLATPEDPRIVYNRSLRCYVASVSLTAIASKERHAFRMVRVTFTPRLPVLSVRFEGSRTDGATTVVGSAGDAAEGGPRARPPPVTATSRATPAPPTDPVKGIIDDCRVEFCGRSFVRLMPSSGDVFAHDINGLIVDYGALYAALNSSIDRRESFACIIHSVRVWAQELEPTTSDGGRRVAPTPSGLSAPRDASPNGHTSSSPVTPCQNAFVGEFNIPTIMPERCVVSHGFPSHWSAQLRSTDDHFPTSTEEMNLLTPSVAPHQPRLRAWIPFPRPLVWPRVKSVIVAVAKTITTMRDRVTTSSPIALVAPVLGDDDIRAIAKSNAFSLWSVPKMLAASSSSSAPFVGECCKQFCSPLPPGVVFAPPLVDVGLDPVGAT